MHQKRVSLLQLLNPLTKFLDFLFLFLCHPAKLQGFVLKPLSSGLEFIECLILEAVWQIAFCLLLQLVHFFVYLPHVVVARLHELIFSRCNHLLRSSCVLIHHVSNLSQHSFVLVWVMRRLHFFFTFVIWAVQSLRGSLRGNFQGKLRRF